MTETVRWEPVEPPEKLLVRWEGKEGFWPLNVVDPTRLPPPEKLEKMSADDMLRILAASDPGGAIRAWAKDHGSASDGYEDELDSSAPPDLDPLRRYDLHETFLKRVVRRAKILARVRENLQRPAWGVQALEWRLYGLIGIETLADRMLRQFHEADGRAHEALLTLADLLIVLDQVEYNGQEGALSTSQFKDIYRPFLAKLAGRLDQAVRGGRHDIDKDLLEFWGRVVKRCR